MRKYTLILAAFVLLAGAASAQQNASSTENGVAPGLTPASPFYSIEIFVESLEVKIAGAIGGSDMKAKAMANNAEERVSEARYLVENNRSSQAAEAVERYSRTLNKSIKLASRGQDEGLKQKINNISSKNVDTLKQVKEKVPEQAKGAIENAINQSGKRRGPPERALNKTESPGQSGLNGTEVPGKAEKRPNRSTGGPEAAENITDRFSDRTSRNQSEGLEENVSRKEESVKNSAENVTGSIGSSSGSDAPVDRDRGSDKITENSSLTDQR